MCRTYCTYLQESLQESSSDIYVSVLDLDILAGNPRRNATSTFFERLKKNQNALYYHIVRGLYSRVPRSVLSKCPPHTINNINSRCGKERLILIGPR